MDYVPKSKFFLSAFFTESLSENNVFDIVKKKRMILREKKNKLLKRAKKRTFSKGVVSPWILSKNRTFSYRCFYRNYVRKHRFWMF